MNFREISATVEVSECGQYEMRNSEGAARRRYFNAWHVESDKHVAAGYERAAVIQACRDHAARSADKC